MKLIIADFASEQLRDDLVASLHAYLPPPEERETMGLSAAIIDDLETLCTQAATLASTFELGGGGHLLLAGTEGKPTAVVLVQRDGHSILQNLDPRARAAWLAARAARAKASARKVVAPPPPPAAPTLRPAPAARGR